MPNNMKCAVCGAELYNEFSIYCSKICKNKAENPIQKTELVSLTEKMPNERFNTDSLYSLWQESNGKRDEPNFGLALLSFLFPIVGLIVYLVIKEEKPLKAGSCIKGAAWGFVFSVVLGFTYFIWLDKQDEKIYKQYKIEMQKYEIEMQKIDKEYERIEKELKKRYGY